jgi:hypothetical protein
MTSLATEKTQRQIRNMYRGARGRTAGAGCCAVLLAMLAGCGDDRRPGGTGVDGGGTAQPLYIVAGTIFGMESVTYVVPVPSLAAGTPIDYGQGIEVPGGAGVYGRDRAGHFFVGSGDSPILTRWDVTADGKLTQGKTLSFANYGLSNALVNNSGVVFLSPTKAYFIHQEDLRGVIWNPSTMEIVGALALPPELKKDGFVVVFDGKAQRQGDDLHLVATWANHTDGKYPPGAMVVTIDTTSDAVVSKELDARCSQVSDSMKDPNGDLYYSCSSWSAATHRVLGAEYAAEACLLRIRKGERQFDPSFYVKLSELTGGQVAGALVPGRGAEGFIRVLDEQMFPTAGKTVREVTGAEAWRWWRLDLDKMTASVIDGLAPSAAGSTELNIDGAVYTSLSKSDFSETTLIEMTAMAGPRSGLVLRGFVHNALRL